MNPNSAKDGGGLGILERPEALPGPEPAARVAAQSPGELSSTVPLQPAAPVTPVGAGAPQPIQYPQPEPSPVQAARPSGGVLWAALGVLLAIVVFGVIMVIAVVAATGRTFGEIARNSSLVVPLQIDNIVVPAGSATTADITLDMKAGNISVSGGAANLVDGTFRYNVAAWQPEVNHYTGVPNGTVSIMQPTVDTNFAGRTRNEWDIKLGTDIEKRLRLNLGAGNITLALGGLNVRSVQTDNRAGNTTIDLTGKWNSDLEVAATNAVGNLTINIPEDTGVKITVNKVMGNVVAAGLTKNGDSYTNAAYGKSPANLNIQARVDVGNLFVNTRK